MRTRVALLRAVNVGGTGRLPMSDLKAMCEEVGLTEVRTYIASGNVVFRSAATEAQIRDALETRLRAYAGKPVGVVVRTGEEMAGVLAGDPFPEEPRGRTVALFVDGPLGPDALADVSGRDGERLHLGERVIYIAYGDGMGRSRLRVPAGKDGTARNLNTVARLAAMASGEV